MEKPAPFDRESNIDILSAIAKISCEMFWVHDLCDDKTIFIAAPRQLGIYGLQPEKTSYQHWLNIIREEDIKGAVTELKEALKQKSVTVLERKYSVKVEGGDRVVVDTTEIKRDTAGNALLCVGVIRDVTDAHKNNSLKASYESDHIRQLEEYRCKLEQNEKDQGELRERLNKNLEMLSERDLMLKTSQRIARTGSWKLNLKTGRCTCSEEFFAIYGLDLDFDLTDPEFFLNVLYGTQKGNEILTSVNKLKTHGTPFDIISSVITPIGIQKYIRLVGFPLYTGNILSEIQGVVQDITTFKENEERLKASEEKFFTLFKFTPDFMSLARESDGVIVEVNDKAQVVSGFLEHEMVGKTARELNLWVNPADLDEFFVEYNKNFRATCEGKWRKKDGQLIYIMLSSVRVTIGGENFRLSLVKDITAREEAKEKFSKAFSLSPDLMSIIRESDEVIIEVNENAKAMLGYDREEVLGKATKDLNLWVVPEERDNYYKQYRQNFKMSYEARWRKKNGDEIYVVISAVRVELYQEPHILSSVRDVTARKQADEKFQTIFKLNPDMIAIVRKRDSIIVDVNDKVYDSIGFTKEELIGQRTNLLDIWLSEEDRRQGDFNAEHPSAVYEARIKNKKGEEVFVLVSGAMVELLGEPHLIYITKDITAHKRAEKAAMENVAQLAIAEKKLSEARVMALRSAMNPHFIFNALNSIQFFISKNERQQAIQYLSTFSKLIRGILTSSGENMIKLSDELELLKHYINLELVRFEKKFNVVFDIDPHVDKDIEIPSLVIQPFVENAILHGLYAKSSEGNLKISVKRASAEFMFFEIEDDGIGRVAARKVQAKKNLEHHKSMGVSLAEERLRIINSDPHVAVETEDLVDGDKAVGTRVKIWLRIQ